MAKAKGIQDFGGTWTEEKLKNIRKYLGAYAKIMKKNNFRFAYVDAFAGTGYRELAKDPETMEALFTDSLNSAEPKGFMDGSAKIALEIEPEFSKYIFIEKDSERFTELNRLMTQFPSKAKSIELVNEDANAYLKTFCKKDWSKGHRAVVFLDPFGMQVNWETLSSIAKTEAIDLWILFPLGSGVSRLLKRNGLIPDAWKKKLNDLFGEENWFDEFYQPSKQMTLLDEKEFIKTASFDSISAYFVSRLKTIFPHVLDKPLQLINSKKVPLFLLCFAAGNKVGGDTAVKIAGDILGKRHGK